MRHSTADLPVRAAQPRLATSSTSAAAPKPTAGNALPAVFSAAPRSRLQQSGQPGRRPPSSGAASICGAAGARRAG